MAVSKSFENTIKEYLDNYAKTDPAFEACYKSENKSITKCCDFIVSEVRKMNVQGLSDDEVYQLARHYYNEDKLEFDENINANVVVNHVIELTEEEKAQAKEEALKQYQKEEHDKLVK